jgi:hypothetical protein
MKKTNKPTASKLKLTFESLRVLTLAPKQLEEVAGGGRGLTSISAGSTWTNGG